MKRIIIDNFDMIDHQELKLDANLNILIGPQASGKSTLVKLIFFCRKLRDFLLEYLTTPRFFEDERYISNLINYLRRQFMGYFGTTKHMNPFKVRFDFDVEQGQYVILTLNERGYVRFLFERNVWKMITNYLNEVSQTYRAVPPGALSRYNETRDSVRDYFKRPLCYLFHDEEELIYIPAARSVLSLLSNTQLGKPSSETAFDVDISKIDALFQNFVNLIQDMKPHFNMSLEEMIPNYRNMGEVSSVNKQYANLAIPIIRSVLHAEYRVDREGEKLYYTDNDYVKLMFASSGQQEALWILNLIFMKILENKRIFLVLEEPEAHLFPKAQKSVVDLIALLIHSTDSGVFITTHSPYILTCVNLCAYSAQVENKLPRQRDDVVVSNYLRVPPKKYNAFMTPEKNERSGNAPFLESIKDEESGLIDATRIDEISNSLNEDMDRLIDLEVQYGL